MTGLFNILEYKNAMLATAAVIFPALPLAFIFRDDVLPPKSSAKVTQVNLVSLLCLQLKPPHLSPRDMALPTLPTRPEPVWQKMAQSPLNDTTQPVDIKENMVLKMI